MSAKTAPPHLTLSTTHSEQVKSLRNALFKWLMDASSMGDPTNEEVIELIQSCMTFAAGLCNVPPHITMTLEEFKNVAHEEYERMRQVVEFAKDSDLLE